MMPADADGETPPAVIGRVVDRPGHVDLDTADRIDHLAEAVQVDLGVVVDLDTEQRADRPLERRHAAVGELVGTAIRVLHERVQLGAVLVPVPERDVDEVARDRDHADALADRIERGDDHRVGEVGGA
jgi:hypothetical protein